MTCVIGYDGAAHLSDADIVAKLLPDQRVEQSGEDLIWCVSNKYYQADVRLELHRSTSCSVWPERLQPSTQHHVGAAVLVTERLSDVATLDRWHQLLSARITGTGTTIPDEEEPKLAPEVHLIVADQVDNEQNADQLRQWCRNHGAEFIVLSDSSYIQADVGGVRCFADSWPKRIAEALQACAWPSLGCHSSSVNGLSNEAGAECVPGNDLDDFENLFAQLCAFKEAACSLEPAERKSYAEKVALAFFSALGDEDSDGDKE